MSNLYTFYGNDNLHTTGNPVYSFFGNNQTFYNNMINENSIARHTNFSLYNHALTSDNPDEVKSSWSFEIGKIKRKNIDKTDFYNMGSNNYYDLLGGITVYLYGNDGNEILQNINHINLSVGKNCEYSYNPTKLAFLNNYYIDKHIYSYCKLLNALVIKLPIELFDNPKLWIKMLRSSNVKLDIELKKEMKVRVDLKVAKLDSEEARKLTQITSISNHVLYKNYFETTSIVEDNHAQIDLSLSAFPSVNNNIKTKYGIKDICLRVPKYQSKIKSISLLCKSGGGCLAKDHKVTYDSTQLFYSNKHMFRDTFRINEHLCLIPISLNDHYHPSGDFFVGEHTIILDIEFEEGIEQNSRIEVDLMLNEHRVLVYNCGDVKLMNLSEFKEHLYVLKKLK